MTITVASGKGGTGKTTVAVGLARSLGPGVTLLDCDVDAPNTALFLERPSAPPDSESRFTIPVPRIDAERCTACGACSDFCAYGALARVRATVLFFPDLCHACGGCARVCPVGAIDEVPRAIGTVQARRSADLFHVCGELDVGRTLAPPLIREVKRTGAAANATTTIIDASPGTTCPVVEAARGADVGLLVTENTPFGLHDLALAAQVFADLDLPAGIVINRSGIGYENESRIRELSERFGFPVLMRIRFDESVARGYADGASIVDSVPGIRAAFVKLRDDLATLGTGS